MLDDDEIARQILIIIKCKKWIHPEYIWSHIIIISQCLNRQKIMKKNIGKEKVSNGEIYNDEQPTNQQQNDKIIMATFGDDDVNHKQIIRRMYRLPIYYWLDMNWLYRFYNDNNNINNMW